MVFNKFSTIFQLYRGGQFFFGGGGGNPEKTTDLSLVTDKLLLVNCNANCYILLKSKTSFLINFTETFVSPTKKLCFGHFQTKQMTYAKKKYR
jgi:hypothetical protein